jgi:RHS repeat-associated protein
VLTSLSYTKGATTLFSLSYSGVYPERSRRGSAGSNDGLIAGITDNVDNGRSASYSGVYPERIRRDALGRLSAASTAGSTNYPAWGLSWTYDRYGNRTAQSIASGCSGITCPTNSVTVSTTTNQITDSGYGYDSSGNMTSDGYNTLTYDAASRTISASNGSSSGAYVYDGNGLRVKKCVPNCSSPTTTTVYVFSGSKVIAEYENGAAAGSPTREYVYSGGLLATIDSSGTKYHHSDHLSARLTTDSSGNKAGEQSHFPFGESWYSANSTTKIQFTTYERDNESGNDYAMARYNVSRLGRFSMPDLLGGTIGDPQSLNHYPYTADDPINHFDPFGICIDCIFPGQIVQFPIIREGTIVYARPSPAQGYAGGSGGGGADDMYGLGDPGGKRGGDDNGLAAAAASGNGSGGGVSRDKTSSSSSTDANAIALGRALNKFGIQAFDNPCTYVAWVVAAGGIGFFGAAVAGAEGATIAVDAVYNSWPDVVAWLFKQSLSKPAVPSLLHFLPKVKDSAIKGCNALQP